MILVDTSVIVAWLDPRHPEHQACIKALDGCAAAGELAINAVTLAELAASGRTREALAEDFRGFVRVALDEETALRAGQAYARRQPGKLSLVDFLKCSHAEVLGAPILTLNRRGLRALREVDFLIPALEGRGPARSGSHAPRKRPTSSAPRQTE